MADNKQPQTLIERVMEAHHLTEVSYNDIGGSYFTIENIKATIIDAIKASKEQVLSADNKEPTAESIVEENFKGLAEFIKDEDILHWYKDLIVTCMEGYANLKTVSKEQISKQDEDIEKMIVEYLEQEIATTTKDVKWFLTFKVLPKVKEIFIEASQSKEQISGDWEERFSYFLRQLSLNSLVTGDGYYHRDKIIDWIKTNLLSSIGEMEVYLPVSVEKELPTQQGRYYVERINSIGTCVWWGGIKAFTNDSVKKWLKKTTIANLLYKPNQGENLK